MLQAYMDDSGNHAESPVTVLAGFVANAENWGVFDKEWQDSLAKDRLEYFKMKECHSLTEQFRGWEAPRRDAKLMELTDIIKRTALASTFAIITRSEYNAFVAQYGRPKGMRSPYFLLYHSIISACLRSMRDLKIEDKVNFVFDEQFKLGEQVQAHYSEVVHTMEPSLAKFWGARPTHKKDEECRPLQAADLLAWNIRRWYYEDGLGRSFATPCIKLLRSIPFWGMIHNQESLAKISEVATEQHVLRQIRDYFSDHGFRERILQAVGSSRM